LRAKPRGILFDLDDTLISAYANQRAAWTAVVAELANDLRPLPPATLVDAIVAHAAEFWSDAERHRHWRQRLMGARRAVVAGAITALRAAGHSLPPPDAGDRLADRFSRYREEQMYLFEHAHAVLDALRAAGVALALVTNGAAVDQRPKITRFDLGRRFDHIQIEGEHGFGKPEERAYRHATASLGLAPEDCWMVGDNLEWEVAAPQRLGMFSVWYDSTGGGLPAGTTVRPDLTVRSLQGVLDAFTRPGAPPD
jgi:putative hydrolase of the HAD superfamily